MNPTNRNGLTRKILYSIGGLAGINLIIFIHEMGHFLFAKLFNVPALSFSLGFGPALWELPIGQTIFKLSLLPFGGYVELDPKILDNLSYIPHMLILGAGILFNLIFAYIVLLYYSIQDSSLYKSHVQLHSTIQQMGQEVSELIATNKREQTRIIGPIGIIAMIGKCLAINPHLYWFILAILSLNIGLFNILPLPFFDGGKALIVTIETLTGTIIPTTILWIISTIVLALFILFFTRITINDIKQLASK